MCRFVRTLASTSTRQNTPDLISLRLIAGVSNRTAHTGGGSHTCAVTLFLAVTIDTLENA